MYNYILKKQVILALYLVGLVLYTCFCFTTNFIYLILGGVLSLLATLGIDYQIQADTKLID